MRPAQGWLGGWRSGSGLAGAGTPPGPLLLCRGALQLVACLVPAGQVAIPPVPERRGQAHPLGCADTF